MKKFTVVLVLALLCAALFAQQAISFSIAPFSRQRFVTSDEYASKHNFDKRGYEATFSYMNSSGSPLTAGLDVSAALYQIDKAESYKDVALLAKVGFSQNVLDHFYIFAFAEAGADCNFLDKDTKPSIYPVFGAEAGLGIAFSDSFALFGGAEGLASFSKEGDTKYTRTRINAQFGFKYTF